MKKNLVTGATGIVGSHVLLSLLQKNEDVIACRQKSSNIQKVLDLFSCYTDEAQQLFEKIKWIEIDLKDVFLLELAFEGVTCVYHCAGYVSFNSVHRKHLLDTNVNGTRNVVNACIHQKVEALCYVSSLSTLHNLDITEPLDEHVFWKSSGKESDYAFSKYKAELEVWRGIEEGLNSVIVNPGVILSPVFWDQSSGRIFNTCYKGNRFYPLGTTAYIAAADVANCMIRLLENKIFGQRFILVEGNYSYKMIFSHIQKAFHKKPPFIPTKKSLLYLGWFADSILSFLFDRPALVTKAVIRSAMNTQTYSNNKIFQTLGYKFKPTFEQINFVCEKYLKVKEIAQK